jgi:CheY-like chemotaxis protein
VPSVPRAIPSGPGHRDEPRTSLSGEHRVAVPSVLVVDDNVRVRLDLRGALHAAGFVVTACDSRTAAIQVLRTRTFDLVILDVILQDGTGLELARMLRSMPDTASIPVILLASDSGMKERARSLDLGDEVILKPYVTDDLVRSARRLARLSIPPESMPRADAPRVSRPRVSGVYEVSSGVSGVHERVRHEPSHDSHGHHHGHHHAEKPRAGVDSMEAPSFAWRNQGDVPAGSLLYRAVVQSGIAAVIGPVTVARACKRAGVDVTTSAPWALQKAVPAIRDMLGLFLTESETTRQVRKMEELLRSLPPE